MPGETTKASVLEALAALSVSKRSISSGSALTSKETASR